MTVFAPWSVLLWHDGALEAVLGGFAQALVAEGYGANLTRQPHFTERDHILRQRTIIEARHRRQQRRQIRRGLIHTNTAHHIHEHVMCRQQHATMAMQHGQQQRQTIPFPTPRHSAWVGGMGLVDERLHTRRLPRKSADRRGDGIDPLTARLRPHDRLVDERCRFPGRLGAAAGERPDLVAGSCVDQGGNNEFVFEVVRRLRAGDERWGLNWKRGNIGDMSQDAIDYFWADGDPEGRTEVYILDIISGHCGDSPGPAWTDVTEATRLGGTIGRWTVQPLPR